MDNGQSLSKELAKQKLEAEARKAIAEAKKAAAEADAARISALIPDFSNVDRGELEVSGDQAMLGSLLGHMALERAAKKVATSKVGEEYVFSTKERVLVTSETDLASLDAVYLEVKNGLSALTSAAEKLLDKTKEAIPPSSLDLNSILLEITSVLPAMLSLFSAKRDLSSFKLTTDTTAATAAVTSALIEKKVYVQIDDFRIVPYGEIVFAEEFLRVKLSELVTRKIELEGKAQSIDSTAEEQHAIKILAIGELIKNIDAFFVSLHAIPSGSKRSPFATAMLAQYLHSPEKMSSDTKNEEPKIDKVLFINAYAGSIDQLINDRPLFFNDKFHSIGTVSIAYWVIHPSDSYIKASGIATGIAEISGKIGGKLKFKTNLEEDSSRGLFNKTFHSLFSLFTRWRSTTAK